MSRNPAQTRARTVFRDLSRTYGKQAALAHAIGWPAPKVSRILAGEQAITWDEVMEAVDRVLEDDPSAAVDVARSLGRNVAGVIVEPVEQDTTPRVWETELVEGMTAEAAVHRALHAGDIDAYDLAAEARVEELRQQLAAGRQRLASPGLRVAR